MKDRQEYEIMWRAEMGGKEHDAELADDIDKWHDPGLCDELNPKCDSQVECSSYEPGGPVENA